MTPTKDRRAQAFEAFKKAWEECPSQDNEGYVPDRGGFKCGWFAALQWADSTPWPQGGDEEAAVRISEEYEYIRELPPMERPDDISQLIYEACCKAIAHARRAQNAEIEQFRDDNFYLKKKS